MSDIADRLRLLVPSDSSGAAFDGVNEITRLTAENEKLRAALEPFVCDCKSNCEWERDEVCPNWNARAALAQGAASAAKEPRT